MDYPSKSALTLLLEEAQRHLGGALYEAEQKHPHEVILWIADTMQTLLKANDQAKIDLGK